MATHVNIRGVIDHILRNQAFYPGPHNQSSPRTSRGLAPLDPARQMELVWEGIAKFIKMYMEKGNAVFIRGFGTLSFNNVYTDAPTRHNRSLVLDPFYMPSDEIQVLMTKHVIKQIEHNTLNTLSSYDRPARVCYLNPRPIAAVTYLPANVVLGTVSVLFTGIHDLVARGYTVALDIPNVARVIFEDRTFKAHFAPNIHSAGKLNGDKFLGKVAKEDQKSLASKKLLNQSIQAMMFDHLKPNTAEEGRRRQRTKNLRDKSFDMVSISSVISQGAAPI